jgi:hypothetical protein
MVSREFVQLEKRFARSQDQAEVALTRYLSVSAMRALYQFMNTEIESEIVR